MRALAAACLLAALLAAGVRLCTGLVYGEDSPVTYLVLRQPGSSVVRKATPQDPLPRRWVLDEEEPDLSYRKPYLGFMQAAPIVVGVCLLAAAAAVAGRRASV